MAGGTNMQNPAIGIQAAQLNAQQQRIPEDAVAKAAERIKGCERRPATAHRKAEAIALQQTAEATEIQRRRRSLQAPQLIGAGHTADQG